MSEQNLEEPSIVFQPHASRLKYVQNNLPQLRAVLSDPVYRVAVSILRDRLIPGQRSISTTPEINNNALLWLSGFLSFDEELNTLLNTGGNVPMPADIPGWDWVEPPARGGKDTGDSE